MASVTHCGKQWRLWSCGHARAGGRRRWPASSWCSSSRCSCAVVAIASVVSVQQSDADFRDTRGAPDARRGGVDGQHSRVVRDAFVADRVERRRGTLTSLHPAVAHQPSRPAASTSTDPDGRRARHQRPRRSGQPGRPRRQHRASSCARGPVTSTTSGRPCGRRPGADHRRPRRARRHLDGRRRPTRRGRERARGVAARPAHLRRRSPWASAWPAPSCSRG